MRSLLEIGERKIVLAAASRGGRYGWCATTKMRWKIFCEFCDGMKIFSVSQITPELLQQYADENCKDLAVSTAQNYISAVNTVLKLIDPAWVSCSPRKLTGRSRKFVRVSPLNFTEHNISTAVLELENLGYEDLSLLVQLSSEFGLRRREVALLDIPNALKEARKYAAIDIQRGTKGGRGRSVERMVPCGDVGIDLLERAEEYLVKNTCLVPIGKSLKNFYGRISIVCLPVLKRNGIEKVHELRTFYACRRYGELTGCVAPCSRSFRDSIASPEQDEQARKIISEELGHSRIQIVSSYIGRKIRRVNGR
jgi:Integrase